MRLSRQPVPVRICLPVEGSYTVEHTRRAQFDWERDRVEVEHRIDLPPETVVIIKHLPGFERYHRFMTRLQYRNTLYLAFENEDGNYIIEPHGRKGHRQFRKSNLFQARYPEDCTTIEYVSEGRPKKGCRNCKWAKRRAWPRWHRKRGARFHAREHRIGCSQHVQQKRIEKPHPEAGKVFATFSGHKILGWPPETEILVQLNGEWTSATILDYPYWTAFRYSWCAASASSSVSWPPKTPPSMRSRTTSPLAFSTWTWT